MLGELTSEAVAAELSAADEVVTSDLTLVECHRVLIRAVEQGAVSEGEAIDRRGVLNRAAVHWHRLRLDDDVMERASRPFPVEPVRTLDALHLCCAHAARSALPDLAVLSLERRVRDNARALGFTAYPKAEEAST